MKFTATAPITIANQPAFDAGGFAAKLVKVFGGVLHDWETLEDTVTLDVTESDTVKISIENIVHEQVNIVLPTDPTQHTGGIALLKAIEILQKKGINWTGHIHMTVRKGISIQGTGLGSSAATPAAALKAFELLLESQYFESVFTLQEVLQILIAADFGVPDNVIPSYYGKMVVMESQGVDLQIDFIEPENLFGKIMIVLPRGFGISTQKARELLKGKSSPASNPVRLQVMLSALRIGNLKSYAELLEDVHDWFVSPRSSLYPDAGEYFEQMVRVAKSHDAFGVTISGAGPALVVFAYSSEELSVIGNAMREKSLEFGYDAVAFEVGF